MVVHELSKTVAVKEFTYFRSKDRKFSRIKRQKRKYKSERHIDINSNR